MQVGLQRGGIAVTSLVTDCKSWRLLPRWAGVCEQLAIPAKTAMATFDLAALLDAGSAPDAEFAEPSGPLQKWGIR